MADNLNGILDNIRGYASEKVAEIQALSKEKCDAVIAAARSEAAAIDAETSEKIALEKELIGTTYENDFRTYKRDKELALKQELIGQVYDRTVDILCGLPAERKLSLYREWIAKYAEEGSYTVRLCAEDLKAFGAELSGELSSGVFPGKPELSDIPGSFRGGIVLEYQETRQDLTFEAAVGELRGKADGEIIREIYRD